MNQYYKRLRFFEEKVISENFDLKIKSPNQSPDKHYDWERIKLKFWLSNGVTTG